MAFAQEMAFTADETVDNRSAGETTIGNTGNYSQSNILQLEKSLRIMQLEIGTLKSTIKDLQGKVVKSEMADLKDRLDTLQKEIFALEGADSDPLSDYERLLLDSSLRLKEPASDREIFVESLEDVFSSAQQGVSELKQKLVEDLTDSPKATVIKETTKSKEAFKEKILEQQAAEEEHKAEEEKLANIEVTKLMTKLTDADAEVEVSETVDVSEDPSSAEADSGQAEQETETSEEEKVTEEEVAEEEVVIEPAPSIITQKGSGRSLFQFPRSLEHNTGQAQPTTQVISAKTIQAKYLKTDIPSSDHDSAPAELQRQPLVHASEPFSGRNLIFLGSLLALALIGLIFWLSRYEKRLFGTAARHFQSFNLPQESLPAPHRKKSSRSKRKIL